MAKIKWEVTYIETGIPHLNHRYFSKYANAIKFKNKLLKNKERYYNPRVRKYRKIPSYIEDTRKM